MHDAEKSQLGKHTQYDSSYDPGLLFPLARSTNRERLNLSATLPFHGEDLWTGYELSWLEAGGKPRVAVAHFRFSAGSPNMIESKSFKLYLNGLNHKRFDSDEALRQLLVNDLSAAAGSGVLVDIVGVRETSALSLMDSGAICIDELQVNGFEYQPNSGLLRCDAGSETGRSAIVEESLYSDLLRSNCPVTGQPDWGSVYIRYRGAKINRESLLRYVVSFRQCQDFHENCVERMFIDILEACKCLSLSVYARYTRRGGLDINPYRATRDYPSTAETMRTSRQ